MMLYELLEQGIVNYIIKEPKGGALYNPKEMSVRMKRYICDELSYLIKKLASILVK